MFPTDEVVYSCHAHQFDVRKLSGSVPGADKTTYCAYRFDDEVELPKCFAAAIASAAICPWVDGDGAAEVLSYQTPAKAFPLGYPTCGAPLGQAVAPVATREPSQYWVIVPDHSSLPVPRFLNISWRYGAPLSWSADRVRSPFPSDACVPH